MLDFELLRQSHNANKTIWNVCTRVTDPQVINERKKNAEHRYCMNDHFFSTGFKKKKRLKW